MKKRMICLFLSAAILLGTVCLSVGNAAAASAMKASGDVIALIKSFEGFSERPYYDYGHWTVGYGTQCEEGEYPDGITEEEAEKLLQEYIASFEKSLNQFINKYSLKLKQCQFDALLAFTYNVGTGWMSDTDHLFTDAVISGADGNDFIFAITRWCTVTQNGERVIRQSLVNRRLVEANLYLNGVYAKTAPSYYQYVIFDNNIDYCVNDVRIQGYDNRGTDGLRAAPTKSGYRFLGWYTEPDGGEWITGVGPETIINTVYGHWQEGNGAVDEQGNVTGTKASYRRYALADTVVWAAPSDTAAQTGKLKENEMVDVVADYLDGNLVKWAKTASGGWVKLAETAAAEMPEPEQEPMNPVTVRVTGSGVNIRSGPGTNYTKQGTFTKGQELVITEVRKGGSYEWGKSSVGWICLTYTNYDHVKKNTTSGTEESTSGTEEESFTGKVVKTSTLNVRSGPGTSNPVVAKLHRGDPVKITQQKKVGSITWGKMEKGWIALQYVQKTTAPAETEPEETKPDEEQKPDTDPVIATGTVSSRQALRIRAGAGTSFKTLGTLPTGTKVQILETKKSGSLTWGRIQQGWICMQYVKLDGGQTQTGTSRITGVVVKTDKLRVRSDAGVQNKQVGTLARGTAVEILETKKVGSTTWGRISKGWISLYYVKLDTAAAIQAAAEKTVTASSLNIRAGVGTGSRCVGVYHKGDQVKILEQTKVKNTLWGRTEKGWICMKYVK